MKKRTAFLALVIVLIAIASFFLWRETNLSPSTAHPSPTAPISVPVHPPPTVPHTPPSPTPSPTAPISVPVHQSTPISPPTQYLDKGTCCEFNTNKNDPNSCMHCHPLDGNSFSLIGTQPPGANVDKYDGKYCNTLRKCGK